MRRLARSGAILLLFGAAPLAAQLAPPGAPRGALRIDIRGSFESADRRLFDGQSEDYLADFGSAAFGSDRMAFLSTADSLVGAILGQPGYRLNLGAQRVHGQLVIGTAHLGAALGLTSKLTLFVNVPLVTTRVQTNLRLDSAGADGGVNLAHPSTGTFQDQQQALAFFTSFDAAINTLTGQINGGGYTPQDSLAAETVLADAIALRDQLYALTSDPALAMEFVPTTGSTTGQAIVGRVRTLQDTLTGLGVGGFAVDPVLAANRLTDQELSGFIGNATGRMAAFPPSESKISHPGDMDVGAIYTFIDRFDQPGKQGGLRVAATALLRLPTGLRDNPANFVDVGTGNGRYEVGLSGTADIGRGLVGARLTGGYLLRLPSLRVRRVGLPSQPYAEAYRLTNVRLDAGDVLSVGVRPFFRLARDLAVLGVADYWRAGSDDVTYYSSSDAIPGVQASDLARDSQRSALVLGGGVTYVGRGRVCQPGQACKLPIEANWQYTTVMNATGGRVERFRATHLGIRWYHRLWH